MAAIRQISVMTRQVYEMSEKLTAKHAASVLEFKFSYIPSTVPSSEALTVLVPLSSEPYLMCTRT